MQCLLPPDFLIDLDAQLLSVSVEFDSYKLAFLGFSVRTFSVAAWSLE